MKSGTENRNYYRISTKEELTPQMREGKYYGWKKS